MTTAPLLVGREDERRRLADALARCRGGAGGLLLISGEAGVGKSSLVRTAVAGWAGRLLTVRYAAGVVAHRPLLDIVGSTADDHAWEHDLARGAVLEQLPRLAQDGPTVAVLEDLHLADAATIQSLVDTATTLDSLPLLLVGVYRSDELPRGHAIRGVRAELRRTHRLDEIALSPLTSTQTHELLAHLLDAPPSPALTAAVHERTEGLPFFVEEIAAALTAEGALAHHPDGLILSPAAVLPLPETVVDAVLARTREQRARHGEAVELAAAYGLRIDLSMLADLVAAEDLDQLIETGLLVEIDERIAVFRHALVRDALHRSIPWSRRRDLHRRLALLLTQRRAPAAATAAHWLCAQEPDMARPLLLATAEEHCRDHAYRDAVSVMQMALTHWPESDPGTERTAAMERLAACAELCGDTPLAATMWEQAARRHASDGAHHRAGAAHRRAANAAEILGDLSRTAGERMAAGVAFARAGHDGDAAGEYLALAEGLKAAGRLSEALVHAIAATECAERAARADVCARGLGLQGALRAALGDASTGVDLARRGVELALAERLQAAAGAVYSELAEALEYAADYARAVNAYQSAVELCRVAGLGQQAAVCLACMSPVVRLMGEWDRTLAICAEVLDDEEATELARRVAEEESGVILALRGDARRARGRLRRAASFGSAKSVIGLELGALWGLALVAELEQDDDLLPHRVSALLARARHTEESHYSLPPLRWAASLLAERGDAAGLAECHRTVAGLATRNGSKKVLSALAHVGAELALAEGEAPLATRQFARSVTLLDGTTAPYEQAHTRWRLGHAHAVQGDRDHAVSNLNSAYRSARHLGARPLVVRCVAELAALGEHVDQRLGRLAGRATAPSTMTRREQEVLRHLAAGLTNRQIASELFVSTRTVDMHVRNLLAKLGCSTRTAAVHKAISDGLLAVNG